ncbi:MAG TPA: response regulator [Usitatibacter sp.]|nr:response regulator [Usitatibacter sp.]
MSEDFKRIVESLRAGLATADAKGAITFANDAFARLTGRDHAALVGTQVPALFSEGDRKRIAQNIARVGDGKAAASLVDARVDRSDRWVQVALQPALGARDKADGVVVVLRDIGPERETEEALNLSAARLLALTEASSVATMVENAQGEVELANEAFCKALGLKSAPQSLAGVPVSEVLAKSTVKNPEALLSREPILVDDVEAGAVWKARESKPKSQAGVKDDAEIALIEKIGTELSIAMEGISAITIRAQQLEFDPVLVDHFQRIRASTETAVAAIGDIIDFSKVSGGVVLHKTRFGLRAALADLITRLGPNAEEHGCRLRIKVEQDVTDSLEGDIERLLLVLKNLLDNAFALVPGQEVMLQVTPEYETESGIQLSFSVIVQGDAAQPVSADAGMGIALAKFMVAAMGGKLGIATRLGADALYAFTLEFPVVPAPPAPRRATFVSLVGLPVMVVSGDPEQRLQITNLLRGWRMIPLEADNAAMAMALLERYHSESSPISLVILSNRLPVQDGFLLAFRIKNHAKFSPTLVMMLATDGRPGDAIACRENGIAAYMRYPIADRQLNEAIVAVTGASVDADETPTLVTRHSLREHRKGATILLIDPNRESQILASHILGRQDCSVVAAQDLEEATAALDQDMYDIVLVDTGLAGLGGEDAATLLRSRIARDADKAYIVAVSLDHSPRYREAKVQAGFNATLAKPFRKDDLLALLASLGLRAEE